MTEITEKLIKKLQKSKFQNCFQCKWFPKDLSRAYTSIGWCWNVENIESLNFRCKYLRKKVSQALEPFRTNSCICFQKEV